MGSSLMQEAIRMAPMTFAQLTQMTADAVCLLSIPVLIHEFLSGKEYWAVPYVFVGASSSSSTSTTTTTTTSTTTKTGVAAMAMMFEQSRVSIYMTPVLGAMFV